LKNYIVAVCTALLLTVVTAVAQQNSNSVAASASGSGESNGRCLKGLTGEGYRPRSGRNENSPALQRWVSGQPNGPEPAKRATEFPLEKAHFKSLSSVSRTCDPFHAVTPALKRWAIFTPSATAHDLAVSSVGKDLTNAPPQPDAGDDDWHFEIAPYLWAAALKGDLRVRNTTAAVDASFSDIFHNLDFSFATKAEASKGKWRVLIDENYVNLGTTGTGPLGDPIDVQPTLNFFEVGASYAPVIIRDKNSTANESLPPVFSLEVLGGLRYTHFGLGLTRAGNPGVEGSRNLVDFFGGNRVKVRPHPAFTIIGKYTLGGGGSHFAWSVSGLGDFRFRRNMSAWGGYQVLDMDADQASNTIGFNGKLQGLIFGLSIYK